VKKYFEMSSVRCLIAVFFACSIAGSAAAQDTKPIIKFTAGDSARSIPLDIDNNIIRLKVRVNNSRPLMMIFDTGASVTFVHTRVAKELGLKLGQKFDGTATGGPIEGNLAGRATLSVDGAEATNQLLFAQAFPTPPGFEFDGIIGYDFINAFVVDIDYPKKTMNLYDPAKFKYSGNRHVIPLDLKGRRTPLVDTPFMFGRDLRVVARLELDTGADGAFLFNEPFVNKHDLLKTQGKTRPDVGRGAGGEQQRVAGTAASADIGSFKFKDIPVVFSLDHQRSETADGIVGGEILRRFGLIIDYSRGRMILEPNSSLRDPFDVEGE